MTDDIPDQDVPGEGATPDAPVERPTPEVPLVRTARTSEWSFEWRGLIPLAVIAAVAIVGWRVIDAGSGSGGSVSEQAAVVTTTEPVARPTTTVRSTTTAPTTVPVTTTTKPPKPTVKITGEMKPCRFGDNCLVASFTIRGFENPPETFTCIYPNSEREFTFRDGGKDEACITADQGDTITIRVGKVESKTISEENLEGE